MSRPPPPKVQELQEALHAKAKGSPDYRSYALYDKVYRRDVLEWAYVRCRSNDGAPGADRRTFEDIEASGVDRWPDELAADLKAKSYRPQPVRRVLIPKGDGKQRPPGIATIRDRVAQRAVVLVLEPIFEADLEPEQHAYRPNRSALDAVRQVHGPVNTGHTEVIDAGLSGYFDGIPHAELMKPLSRRISDRHLLGLIKVWLETPVEEIDERGRHHRTTRSKDEGRGTPQGSPLSPLLSNVYMRRLVRGWKGLGHERPSSTTPRTGRPYIGTYPSAKKVARLRDEIREMTDRRWLWTDVEERVARLNRKLLGWSNYFRLGPVSRAYRAIDRHSCHRLRRWLCAKDKVKNRGMSRFPDRHLFEELGLIRLSDRTRHFPWANA